MVNRPKARGTAAESAIVRYAAANGFAGAMRPALSGAADRGDVWLEPGPTVIIESKNYAGAPALGQPSAAQLGAWWEQTCIEAVNAGADLGILVVKRKGTTDPGAWFAWVPGWLLACTAGVPLVSTWPALLTRPVATTLDHALRLCRASGYGDSILNI